MTVEGTRPLQLGQQARRLFLTHLMPEVGFQAASPCCSFLPVIFKLCPVLWEKVTHLSGEQSTCWAPVSSLLCRLSVLRRFGLSSYWTWALEGGVSVSRHCHWAGPDAVSPTLQEPREAGRSPHFSLPLTPLSNVPANSVGSTFKTYPSLCRLIASL